MRVTIIPSDSVVTIDGVSFSNIDMSGLDPAIHAVQWYENHGEVEIKNVSTGRMVSNLQINNLNSFQNIISQFNTLLAEKQAEEQSQNIVEV